MRVGIDFRILAVGPKQMKRGMPRFTQQQLRNVLALDHENEYLLLVRDGDDLSLIDNDIRAAHNVSIGTPPGWSSAQSGDFSTMLRRSAELQDWLVHRQVDLFHLTTPFLLVDPYLVDFDACPMVATFYDAIPLIFSEQYLSEYPRKVFGLCRAAVMRASRLLAISESARRDASVHVGYPRHRIDVVSPVADSCFRPLEARDVRRELEAVGQRVRIPEHFMLTVSSTHHTKNAETLLAAYGLLDERVRTRYPLVFCCNLSDAEQVLVRSLADRFGIGDDVIITDLVTDAQLAALYNAATVVVHPSRYEGFGLPVLEAMHCGSPVITTTVSSLPEVAGGAAMLVDPEDPGAMAAAMEIVLDDPDKREAMSRAGLANARRFTGEALGRATLDGYARAVVPDLEANTSKAGRLRLAVWAPLPPEQTGIADYTVELLAGLARHVDLEIFVDDGFLPDLDLMTQYRVHGYAAFERRRDQSNFDAVIYQVGTSFFHLYMNEAMQRYPGIVVLHDLSWSHLLYAYSEMRGEVDVFRAELAELEGGLALRCFDAIAAGPPSLRQEFLDAYPMLGRIVAASPAVVVPFDGARKKVEVRHPEARVRTIIMGVADPYSGPVGRDCAVARHRLGLTPDAYVVGVFGIIHHTKRIEAVIEALPAVVAERPDTVLLIVGRALEVGYRAQLEALAREAGVAGSIRFLGELDQRAFDGALVACDVVVNLRVSTIAHLSATLMRAVAAGKPVITSDVPGWDFLPAASCLRVASGDAEVSTLAQHLCRLGGDAVLRRRMGGVARRFFEREATVEVMVQRYLEVVDEVRATA